MSYTAPTDTAAARLKDLSDNPAASFAARAVTNNIAAALTPLTASIHSEPASHDGQAAFTFELRFSENLEGFSFRTLRDHAFTVTGGEVKRARRLVSGSNIRWTITVRPDGDGTVAIVLPITTDCTAQGAVCTGDGRKLSNRLELTVSGPASRQSSRQQQQNSPATGSPAISGTAQAGETLAASTSGISDADGLTNVSYTYQWVSNDGTSDSDIADATASAYTLATGDVGKTIRVRVTFTDDAGNDEELTSVATGAVAAAPTPNSPATGAPAITGTAQVGETLTAGTLDIADDDGLANVSFSYQWLADDAEIASATGSTYTLVEADEGKAIKVQVSFTDNAGNDETLTSAATGAVDARPNSPATGAPSISGMAQVGETLTANTLGITDEDRLENVSFSYQWLADDEAISGATGSSYTLAGTREGKTIRVRVSFTDDAGNEESLTSEATDAVAVPLTASLENTPDTHDGENVFTFELGFSEEFSLSYKVLRDHAFTVAGGTVTNAERITKGSNLRWLITVRPDGDGQVAITLPVTEDCDAEGAICTGDGRRLSNRLELTVGGPGQ